MKSILPNSAGRAGGVAALLVALTLLPVRATLAQEVDLTGDWILTVESPNGTGTRQVTFEQKGTTLAGSISSSMASGDLTGTFEGDVLTFVATIVMSAGAFDVVYTATFEDGTLRNGTVDFGDYGAGTFTGVRKAPGPGSR